MKLIWKKQVWDPKSYTHKDVWYVHLVLVILSSIASFVLTLWLLNLWSG